jgi:hypothetical protein
LAALPLLNKAIVFNVGPLVAVEAHEILPTKRRSHKSMTLGVAEEQRSVVGGCC